MNDERYLVFYPMTMVIGTLLTQTIPTFSRSHGPGVPLHPEYVRILERSQQILNENAILPEVTETCFCNTNIL